MKRSVARRNDVSAESRLRKRQKLTNTALASDTRGAEHLNGAPSSVSASTRHEVDLDTDDDLPLNRRQVKTRQNSSGTREGAMRRPTIVANSSSSSEAKDSKLLATIPRAEVKSEIVPFESNGARKDLAECDVGASSDGNDGFRWWDAENADNDGVKWRTLSHNAVMFPPEYEPHGVPLLYDGSPVSLNSACEEVATFYAAKLDTDYVKKAAFRENFFHDFRQILKRTEAYRVIKNLDKCDFSRIKVHLDRKRDEKKELSTAERKALREAETEKAKKYIYAIVDGREEKVGNFRVEPPGLFLGRGEHPLMGKVKARIYPEDVTINIGKDAPIPEVPIPGHSWGKIVHDNRVTWLAGWKDTITNGRKYVFLSAGSAFKGMSDREKFEKARMLGKNIDKIRRDYRDGWKSKSKDVRQRSVAMYLIDKLALRVGNEKSEDEADTVGCCSLRVEHIRLISPRTIEFDFLGKDSMRYYNQVEVEKPVYDSMALFLRSKKPADDVFHRLTVAGLNDYLKSLMPGLSAKVFRTYNASVTLDSLLRETDAVLSLNDKSVFYNQQNKQVAILCNHQRTAPKSHDAQMEKLQAKILECNEWVGELHKAQKKFNSAKKTKQTLSSVRVVEYRQARPEYKDGMDDKARAAERKRVAELPRVKTERSMTATQVAMHIQKAKDKLAKLEADMTVKDDLKTVALGTSKINYLDPRITVAWCKKHDVPIERIFAQALLVKFAWAMQTLSDFVF